ncbi:hypothetical protein PLICRDRAFT_37134 [Plicaturopsis crispa FD-325 SS-3]|nr:hypothetical protein PLICRDRAFT_37134 [Plicaturopsis crispa FD-325 SS-3]
MAASAAFPGLLLCFAATVLLVIATVSSPTWEKISFLDVTMNGETTHFGVFGYTGTKVHIGYFFPQIETSRIVHNLTSVLILHPIAAGLAGLSVLFGICGAGYHRAGTVLMSLLATLAALATLVAWVVDMVLFGIARKHFRDAGATAQYGNANWITLGALVALWIGACAAGCGVFGHYRRRRSDF